MLKELHIPVGDGRLPNRLFAPASNINNAPWAEEARLSYA